MKGQVENVKNWRKRPGCFFEVAGEKYFVSGKHDFLEGDLISFEVDEVNSIEDSLRAHKIVVLEKNKDPGVGNHQAAAPQDEAERILRCVALEQAVDFMNARNANSRIEDMVGSVELQMCATDFLEWLKVGHCRRE